MKLETLLEKNQQWAKDTLKENAEFFNKLVNVQRPEYLWIGCSDSRVPANTIVGLQPGELFVHRNIANIVPHTDINALSVIEFAVNVLQVKHIIVTGHYGCGGVEAALESKPLGIIDNWLCEIKDIYRINYHQIHSLPTKKEQVDRLCELNVMQQVKNVACSSAVQQAWQRKQSLTIHGWIYRLSTGLIHDLQVSINKAEQLEDAYRYK